MVHSERRSWGKYQRADPNTPDQTKVFITPYWSHNLQDSSCAKPPLIRWIHTRQAIIDPSKSLSISGLHSKPDKKWSKAYPNKTIKFMLETKLRFLENERKIWWKKLLYNRMDANIYIYIIYIISIDCIVLGEKYTERYISSSNPVMYIFIVSRFTRLIFSIPISQDTMARLISSWARAHCTFSIKSPEQSA